MGKETKVEIASHHGRIWNKKLVSTKEGLLSTFVGPKKGEGKAPNTPFVCAAFNDTGEVFAGGDRRGHLFLFYIRMNRYCLACQLEKPAHSIAFTKRKNEEVVAASGSVARVFDIDSHRLTATLHTHKHAIIAMESCTFGARFLTTSCDVCILWDIKTWAKTKSLWAETAHLVNSRFVPSGSDICTSFKDFRVVLWSTANFQLRREFKVDMLSEVMHHLAPSRRYICAGGSRTLVVWSHKGDLTHMSPIGTPVVGMRVGEVREHRKQAESLFLLRDDGQLQVIHLESLQILVSLSATHAIIHFDIDPSSSHLLGVLANGVVKLWDFRAVLAREREELQLRARMGAPEHLLVRSLPRKVFPLDVLHEVKDSTVLKEISNSNSGKVGRKDAEHLVGLPDENVIGSLTASDALLDETMGTALDDIDIIHQKSRKFDEVLGMDELTVPDANKCQDTNGSERIPSSECQPETRDIESDVRAIRKFNAELDESSMATPASERMPASVEQNGVDLPVEIERDIFAPLRELYGIQNRLSVKRLRTLLLQKGQYPDAHRCLIWRYLLQLPYNQDAFECLVKKGLYPRFSRLQSQFAHSSKECHRLEKLLSAFAHYCVLFGEVSYLPHFVFPFLSLFGRDMCLTFEVCLSVILNWCNGWFTFFPNLPVALLSRLDATLSSLDPELYRHLSDLTKVGECVLWPIMTTVLSDVLCRQDWHQLWDHLITHYTETELLYAAILSFLQLFRHTLLKIRDCDTLDSFLHAPQPCSMKLLIKGMYSVRKSHFDGRLFPTQITSVGLPFETPCSVPLPLETYPHFCDFPRFIVDERDQIDRLRLAETRAHDFRSHVQDIEEVARKMRDEEELFHAQQEELMLAADERQKLLRAEDKNAFRDRRNTDDIIFQRRIDAIKSMQHSLRTSLIQQRDSRLKENERIIDEMNRRQRDKEYEMQTRIKEESLLNLEMEAHTQLSGLVQQRRNEDNSRSLRQQVAQSYKEQELNEELQKQMWRVEDEKQRAHLTQLKQQKLNELADSEDEQQRREILMEMRLKNLERQISLAGVARERALRKIIAEFELKEEEAERLRRRHTGIRMESDRRGHEANATKTIRMAGTLRDHGFLQSEVHRFESDVDAREQRDCDDRETRVREVFDEHLARLQEDMDEERAKDEDSIREVLHRVHIAGNKLSMPLGAEVDRRPTARERELATLIAQREAHLSHLMESFRQDSMEMSE